MKKNVLRTLAAVLALTMLFSLAACGDDKGSGSSTPSSSESSSAADDSSSESSTEESSSEAEDSSEESSAASTGAADGVFPTVKAFLEDPTTKAQLDASIEQMLGGDDSMDVSLDGTEDTLIYMFKFSDEALEGADESTLKATLDEGLNEATFVSTFENIAGTVAQVVEADSVKVKVVYAKADGTEIASKEYTGK